MESILIEINEQIRERLPKTYEILKEANLTVHPYVYKVVLTGSRGLASSYREDSDIDLSLIVDRNLLKIQEHEEETLKDILQVTLSNWKSRVEIDTVAVFDINDCDLKCFDYETENERKCTAKGIDCIGLYKLQKGFTGYVPKIGIDIKRIYPMITVWKRK